MAGTSCSAGSAAISAGSQTVVCSFAGTPDLIHMLIHLLQLDFHVWAVHVVGMAHMVYTQVMPNQQVPLVCLPHAWHQILCTMAQVKLAAIIGSCSC